jgi:hypothetical protein
MIYLVNENWRNDHSSRVVAAFNERDRALAFCRERAMEESLVGEAEEQRAGRYDVPWEARPLVGYAPTVEGDWSDLDFSIQEIELR